jgi:hypothetical protein
MAKRKNVAAQIGNQLGGLSKMEIKHINYFTVKIAPYVSENNVAN